MKNIEDEIRKLTIDLLDNVSKCIEDIWRSYHEKKRKEHEENINTHDENCHCLSDVYVNANFNFLVNVLSYIVESMVNNNSSKEVKIKIIEEICLKAKEGPRSLH